MGRVNISYPIQSFIFKLTIFTLLALTFTLLTWVPAHADVAPAPPPSGSNPVNTTPTQVQMAAETVLFEIAPASPYKNGQAKITATFRMHNAGTHDESMTIQFPLAWGDEHNYIVPCEYSAYYEYPSITDLSAWVNDVSTPTSIETTTVTVTSNEYPDTQLSIPCWADFPVNFPAGKDTTIRVTYTALGYGFGAATGSNSAEALVSGAVPSGWTEFHYILTTGAAWNGLIGTADVIFRFPYEVTLESLYHAVPDGLASNHMRLSGRDVIWHNDNFKPDANVSVEAVNPSVWISLMQAKKAVKANPKDSEAWGQIGKTYKEAAWGKRGFIDDIFYQESDAAYRKAVSLAPNDADWHYGYAELLCWQAMWNSATPDLTACLVQLETTLELRPNYPKALEAILFISNLRPEATNPVPANLIQTAQAFPTPTQSDTPTQALYGTLIPTDTLEPTLTYIPYPTASPDLSGKPIHFPQDTPSFTPSETGPSQTPSPTRAQPNLTSAPGVPTPSQTPSSSLPDRPPVSNALYVIAGLILAAGLVWFIMARRGR